METGKRPISLVARVHVAPEGLVVQVVRAELVVQVALAELAVPVVLAELVVQAVLAELAVRVVLAEPVVPVVLAELVVQVAPAELVVRVAPEELATGPVEELALAIVPVAVALEIVLAVVGLVPDHPRAQPVGLAPRIKLVIEAHRRALVAVIAAEDLAVGPGTAPAAVVETMREPVVPEAVKAWVVAVSAVVVAAAVAAEVE
jgi:hypothetical protein